MPLSTHLPVVLQRVGPVLQPRSCREAPLTHGSLPADVSGTAAAATSTTTATTTAAAATSAATASATAAAAATPRSPARAPTVRPHAHPRTLTRARAVPPPTASSIASSGARNPDRTVTSANFCVDPIWVGTVLAPDGAGCCCQGENGLGTRVGGGAGGDVVAGHEGRGLRADGVVQQAAVEHQGGARGLGHELQRLVVNPRADGGAGHLAEEVG